MHLAVERRNSVDPLERDGLLEAFLDAARAGDMAGLIDQLSAAVIVRHRTNERVSCR
jgi:hypothetical protein